MLKFSSCWLGKRIRNCPVNNQKDMGNLSLQSFCYNSFMSLGKHLSLEYPLCSLILGIQDFTLLTCLSNTFSPLWIKTTFNWNGTGIIRKGARQEEVNFHSKVESTHKYLKCKSINTFRGLVLNKIIFIACGFI